MRRRSERLLPIGWLILATAGSAGAIAPSQVLVVYNSASTDAVAVKDAYLAAHPDIPAANVLDLNSTALANRATITYAEFVSGIRNPIRTYLNSGSGPTPTGIVAMALIRGIPHRIDDTDAPGIGDIPYDPAGPDIGDELGAGDVTCAALDAELVLLWQNLETGEAGNSMDSKSDNLIDNPYHNRFNEPIGNWSRTYITTAKTFTANNLIWQSNAAQTRYRLTPGDMYLVCRIDGRTAADAIATIDRAVGIVHNRRYGWIILDEDDGDDLDDDDYLGLFSAGNDYEEARDALLAAGWQVRYDHTSDFIEAHEHTEPLIAYAGYGENHVVNPPGNGTYIDGFRFARGAVFNTLESYNGRALNGLGTLFNQEQVADFIAAGGTFGIGNVWEPFSFTVADNELLLVNFLVHRLTWAEAAYSALPALSWMQIVVGDPLARVIDVVDWIGDFDADGDVDSSDADILAGCASGPGVPHPPGDCVRTDLDGDGDVDQADFGILQQSYAPRPAP